MKRNELLSILIVILFFTAGCQGRKADTKIVLRDTTITPAIAYSKLFLDSNLLQAFIQEEQADEDLSLQLRNFYNSRNYQYAWFTEDGIAEHTRSFWNLHNSYIELFSDTALKHKNLHGAIDSLLNADTIKKLDVATLQQTELDLTLHFFQYSKNAYAGKVNPKELEWYIPRKKIDAVILLDSFIARDGKNLEGWEPVNQFYQRLKRELVHYHEIEKSGGWQEIAWIKGKKYKAGDSAVIIMQVKKRLYASGLLSLSDSSAFYTDALIPVIKSVQKSFGFHQDGIINTELVNELNVPVKERISQLLINLERMRWVPTQTNGKLMFVNIPEFRLHVIDSGNKQFSIDIVVGKAAHSTVIFTDQLKYVVFSPYWNIPASIVRNEILPAMRRNRNYLASKNMEQTGVSNGLPVVRQKPGGSNSLGRVKFIFPNSYNIYFHDTPAKSLFSNENRAFSHGCIRLSEPKRLAEYLLMGKPEWTDKNITDAMYAGKEKWVTLDEAVPVVISYFTAWVDSDDLLNFRKDIYGHDKKLAAHLFQ